MATATSSLIGANLGATGSTKLFALGTSVFGTDGSVFTYVEATSTFITGELVLINPTSTAKTLLTSLLTANAEAAYDIGAWQGIINQGEFGWVAKNGRNLYVLCTGTLTAGGDVGFSANSGRLENNIAVGVGQTAWGIWVSTGISGSSLATIATLAWPRAAIKP